MSGLPNLSNGAYRKGQNNSVNTDSSSGAKIEVKANSQYDSLYSLGNVYTYPSPDSSSLSLKQAPVEEDCVDFYAHEIFLINSGAEEEENNKVFSYSSNSSGMNTSNQHKKNDTPKRIPLQTITQVALSNNSYTRIFDNHGKQHTKVIKKQKISKPTRPNSWSELDDSKIKYYREIERLSWKDIAAKLDHKHTRNAIQMRYLRKQKKLQSEEVSSSEVEEYKRLIEEDWHDRFKRINQRMKRSCTEESLKYKLNTILNKKLYNNDKEFQILSLYKNN